MNSNAEDYGAILDVLASWALGYDEREIGRMARCFTDDATMTLEIAGHPTMGPFIGHQEVMKHFTDHHETQTDQRRHLVVNVIVDDRGSGVASTVSNLVLIVTDDVGVRVQATGVYRDEFVKSAGSWKIRRRQLRLDGRY